MKAGELVTFEVVGFGGSKQERWEELQKQNTLKNQQWKCHMGILLAYAEDGDSVLTGTCLQKTRVY